MQSVQTKHQLKSEFSSTSKYLLNKCTHEKTIVSGDLRNCKQCGTFLPKNGNKTFKTTRMNYKIFFNIQDVKDTINKKQLPKRSYKTMDYIIHRRKFINEIFDLAKKLKLSQNSAQLGVYLLDLTMTKLNTPIYYISLYAATSLFTAAKTIELDLRIPFIPKLIKYCQGIFSVNDVRMAEIQVLEVCNWNPLYSTILELIEFYLAQGIVFSSDKVKVKKSTKIAKILCEKQENLNEGEKQQPPHKQNKTKSNTDKEGLNVLIGNMDKQYLSELLVNIEQDSINTCNQILKSNRFLTIGNFQKVIQ